MRPVDCLRDRGARKPELKKPLPVIASLVLRMAHAIGPHGQGKLAASPRRLSADAVGFVQSAFSGSHLAGLSASSRRMRLGSFHAAKFRFPNAGRVERWEMPDMLMAEPIADLSLASRGRCLLQFSFDQGSADAFNPSADHWSDHAIGRSIRRFAPRPRGSASVLN